MAHNLGEKETTLKDRTSEKKCNQDTLLWCRLSPITYFRRHSSFLHINMFGHCLRVVRASRFNSRVVSTWCQPECSSLSKYKKSQNLVTTPYSKICNQPWYNSDFRYTVNISTLLCIRRRQNNAPKPTPPRHLARLGII